VLVDAAAGPDVSERASGTPPARTTISAPRTETRPP